VLCYPNAGLPNTFGGYDEEPHTTGENMGQFARDGLVNLVGGCCGTTPPHIKAVTEAVAGVAPRVRPPSQANHHMLLAGLEPLKVPTCPLLLTPTGWETVQLCEHRRAMQCGR